MTQQEFDVILKTLELGVPTLYQWLGGALNNFVNSYNEAVQENEKLKSELEAIQKAKKNHKKVEVSAEELQSV